MQSASPLHDLILDDLQRGSSADDLATTGRFVRPYDEVEIVPKRERTFVHTIRRERARTSASFDTAWFAASEDALVAIEGPAQESRSSWWWLAISLAGAAAALAALSAL